MTLQQLTQPMGNIQPNIPPPMGYPAQMMMPFPPSPVPQPEPPR